MSQPVSGSLLFQDGTSERDFIAVSAQNSSVPDLHYEFRTSSSQYGNGTQVNTTVTGRASTSMHHSSSSGSSTTTAMVLFAEIGWVSNKMGTVKVYITRPPLELATASLCLPGGKIGSRCFLMNWNGVEAKSQFTWTRDNSAYTLTGPNSDVLARYERCQEPTPHHAVMHFYFEDRLTMLMVLLSLTLNRWLDGPNSPFITSR
ncbi:hypothetical protein FRC20_005577 [Serendipita sp. 405]|nr:hypothetical protein FRC20_005577 [Serendipita sp. 405]